jgi:hypothetical protein
VTHNPERKVAIVAVAVAVAVVVLRYSPWGFRVGAMAATWRAMPNDHDFGRSLPKPPLLLAPPPTATSS